MRRIRLIHWNATEASRRAGILRALGYQTDLTQNAVRRVGLGAGLVDFKISAVDATWSGLRFTLRYAE